MAARSTVDRVGAIVFGCVIVGVDGWTTYRQVASLGWPVDTIAVVLASLVAANLLPPWVGMSYRARNWSALALLSASCSTAVVGNYFMTLQRVYAQHQKQERALDVSNYAGVRSSERVAALRAAASVEDAKARAKLVELQRQITEAEAVMDYQEHRAPKPGRGSSWRKAKVLKIAATAEVNMLRTETATRKSKLAADVEALELRIEQLGRPELTNSRTSIGTPHSRFLCCCTRCRWGVFCSRPARWFAK